MTPLHGERLLLLDSYGLIYRAFFALPPLTARDGRPVNAVYGLATMLPRLLAEERPTRCLAAFDAGRPQARLERFPEYKAHRERMPDELRSQIPLIRELFVAYRIPIIEYPDAEADDVIGTIARRSPESIEIRILSGDLDLLQLVTERTTLLVPGKGFGPTTRYDPAAVRARYGLDPAQLPDYRGLKGDPSDNLPGVPGIGEKTAIRLISTYGTLDTLLAEPDKAGTARIVQLLRDHADMARLCRDLSHVVDDLPIGTPWENPAAETHEPDPAKLAALYRLCDFTSLLARLNAALPADTATASAEQSMPAATPPTPAGDLAALAALHTHQRLAVVLHDDGLGCAWSADDALWIPAEHLTTPAWATALATILDGGTQLIAHDAKRLLTAIAHQDTQLADTLRGEALPGVRIGDDTMLAAYLLTPTRAYPHLATAVEEYLGETLPLDLGGQATALWRLAEELRCRLDERQQGDLYVHLEIPIALLLTQMELRGIAVDTLELAQLAHELDASLVHLREEAYRLAGEHFNLDSPRQLGPILFERLGLPGGKRNKTGYATGSEILSELVDQHPLVPAILAYREAAKLKNTYVDVIPTLIGQDGRLHTVYNQTVTTTGRLSSSQPNLQNIPIRSEIGRRIRKAFVPANERQTLLTADYGQIELRLLAHLSEDPVLCAAFASGHDIHEATARRIFSLPDDTTVDAQQRRVAKTVNFGILYGMSEFGLAQRLKISREAARTMIAQYFAEFPNVRTYLTATVEEARSCGYVTTLIGRRRYLPDLTSRDHTRRSAAEREATNAPLQGGAADLMKQAMLDVARALAPYKARLLLQIHDEVLLEVDRSDYESVAHQVRAAMESAMRLRVPLEVSIKSGPTWYEVA